MTLYSVGTPDVLGKAVFLNGSPLSLVNGKALPRLAGKPMVNSGEPTVTVNPLFYTFLQFEF